MLGLGFDNSWQKDVSGGASFTFGSMSGSASLSMSQTKIESEYASVGDQSGLFAGDKGFDINVGNHTQLNGGVIASTADSIKNQLSTGSLGWDAIDNKAEYNASSSGFGISTSGPTGGGLAKEKGKAAGTTQSAVAAGNIDIRNTAAQTQDIAELSRDTDNANGRIDKIFDEAKVKDNLAFTQGVTQLATQLVSDYGNKQMLQAQRAAAEKLSKDPAYLSASAQERQKMLEASPEYKAAQKEYGIGSNFWAAGTAISAALAGISGGDIGAAAGGALAPYLAREIKTRTEGNTAANAAAHAVAGALVALVSGNNVASGAAGAASGELAAKIISEQYYGKDPSALTEAEKQNVSALSQLAAGLAGGLVADSTAGAVGGSVAGKTAVENNFLSVTQLDNFAQKSRTCEGAACQQVIQDMVETNLKQQKEMLAFCSSQPAQCADKYGYLVEQWDVFDQAIKQLDADGKLPNEFKNYLSAVYSSSMEAEGTVANLGWQQKFEALGLDKDTAAAMAATVPALIAAKGPKGSAIPVPTPTKASNGLVYQSNSKHTLGGEGNRPNAGIEPKNSLTIFENSVPLAIKGREHKARYALDSDGNVHRFSPDNTGGYHWSGSTADQRNKLELPNDVKAALRKQEGWKLK
ncbi:Possible hemagglutinin (DUF638) [Serratia grimesii]|nr:Possible hemagglutinin (DUF638) [Serratia grimesii]CAI2499092.1 Possible hemagglutinin (DUF638) [Serratia grimesii]SUI36758.1 Possible hemagglutinin (DUF638) [Serratia grimesii]